MLHPAANRHPKATHQWLLMGIQVCRLPARLQPTGTPGPYINGFSPRPHINGFLWASKSAVCQPSALLQPTGTPGPYINGFSSRPHINGFLWASKSAVCQPSCSQQAPQGHTSMASYGRPSLPFASPQTLKTLQTLQTLQTLKTLQTLQNRKTLPPNVDLACFILKPTATPRPHINGFLWASKSAVCQPACSQQAPQGHTSMAFPQGHTSMASYGHPSLPFASPLAANRHPRAIHQWLLPKATHQWLLMGIQVCRLPARLQPTGTPGPYINGFSPRPHINGFLWASKSAVCQPSCSQQAPQGHTSMASYGHPSLPFASPLEGSQQAPQGHTSMASPQGHTSMASYGHPSLPFASPLAANRHPRATHQWLLMGVQVCRLPWPSNP